MNRYYLVRSKLNLLKQKTDLKFNRLSSETFTNKGGLVDHTFPTLRLALSGLDDLEHLFFGDTPDLGKRHRVFGGSVLSSVLDG